MLLEVNNVSKIFNGKKQKKIVANENITLTVKPGEILGLLGHNGAGKTTLVNQIMGLIKPTSGDITLMGKSVVKNPKISRTFCSIQPQSQIPLGFLTPAQAVTIMGGLRGGKKEDIQSRMKQLFDALDINEWANKEAVTLSGGILRLTSFCMASVVPGNLVILDEPTNDVDPIRRRYLWNEIRKLTDQGVSVILVTHNVLEAEKAVDKVIILEQGKILAQGQLAEIKSSVDKTMRIELSTMYDVEKVILPDWARNVIKKGSQATFSLDMELVPNAVTWLTSEVGSGNILDYSISPANLDDIYVQLTSKREEK